MGQLAVATKRGGHDTPARMHLREKQNQDVSAFWPIVERDCLEGMAYRYVAELPTGWGKAVILAALAVRALRQFDHIKRVLIIVNDRDLADQAHEKLLLVDDAPGFPADQIGIVQGTPGVAGGQNEVDRTITIAMVQTLAQPGRKEQIAAHGKIDLVIVDEAHQIMADTWVEAVTFFDVFNYVPLAGFTATLTREDGREFGGPNGMFQKICAQRGIVELIKDGFLVDIRGKVLQIPNLDLDTVNRARGDMADGDMAGVDLAKKMMAANAGNVMAADWKTWASGPGWHRPTIAFASTLDMAEHCAEEMRKIGIRSIAVRGEGLSKAERRQHKAGLTDGSIQVLWVVGLYLQGWDCPAVSCVLIGAPTNSRRKYVQQVGRGTRLSPETGKVDLLVLDFVGTSKKHTLAGRASLAGDEFEVREDESLLEAKERADFEAIAMAETPLVLSGTTVAEDIEFFDAMDTICLPTKGRGWYFIATAESYIWLSPSKKSDRTLYRLAHMPIWHPDHQWVRCSRRANPELITLLDTGLTLRYGMGRAEKVAMDEDDALRRADAKSASMTSKSAAWRKAKDPITEKQLALLTSRPKTNKPWSYTAEEVIGLSKHQAAVLITLEYGSAALD